MPPSAGCPPGRATPTLFPAGSPTAVRVEPIVMCGAMSGVSGGFGAYGPGFSPRLVEKKGQTGPQECKTGQPAEPDGPSPKQEPSRSLDAFEESIRMKWTCWIAALVVCCGTMNADAGLFGGKGHGSDCCPPTCAAPADCCPPSCAAPSGCGLFGNKGCDVAPTCCAPANPAHCAPACGPANCGPAAPSCCAPCEPVCAAPAACAPACDTACAPSYRPAKKRGCLSRLFDHIRSGRGHGHHHNDCCPPSCAAPVQCN